jgi:SNF family Na+-dependent transporter
MNRVDGHRFFNQYLHLKIWRQNCPLCILGKTVDDVIADGPGLVFVVFPHALAKMPVPQLWWVIFSSIFWQFSDSLGQFLDTLWTLFGHSLDTLRTIVGHLLNSLWTLFWHSLDTLWTLFDSLDTLWTLFRHSLDTLWLFGHFLDTFWTLFGHSLDTFWTLIRHSLDTH